MTPDWMPLYIDAYLHDTGHLNAEQHGAYMLLLMHCWRHGRIPTAAVERAAIARVTPSHWKLIGGPVNRFFAPDGTQKRCSTELAKATAKITKRRAAASIGGTRTQLAKSLARAEARQLFHVKRQANAQANAQAYAQANACEEPQANAQANAKHNKKDIYRPSLTAARAAPELVENPSKSTDRSLATALPAGALARDPSVRVSSMTRDEFDKRILLKRLSQPVEMPCCVEGSDPKPKGELP